MIIDKLQEEGNKAARILTKLLEDPSHFLSTIQVGITLAGFFASATGAIGLSQKMAEILSGYGVPTAMASTIAVFIITVIISYVTLVFGELAPKRLAMQWSEQIALKVARPITILSHLTLPMTKLLTLSTNLVVSVFGGNPRQQEKEMSEDEIRYYVAKNKGLPLEEKQMIEAVFDFGDRIARQVMVPRTEITYLHADDSIKDALVKVCSTGFHSFPVYQRDYDDVIGMVKIQDLTCHLLSTELTELNSNSPSSVKLNDHNHTLKEIITPILYVPETKDTVELLKEFRLKKTGIAMIVDEYGGTSGLITIEDLVDELVGDITHDNRFIKKADEGQWLVKGDTPMEDIIESLHIKTLTPDANYETIAGFILEQLGHLPLEGETLVFEHYQFIIQEMGRRRIKTILITKMN